MEKSNLGDRMKSYEEVSKTSLMKRTPVIIRLDGKAFHTYTNGMPKPFFEALHLCMVETMRYLCENIQGVKFGYTQSDEISLLLRDDDNLETQAWYDNQAQKIVSVSASMAAAKFNQEAAKRNLKPSKEDPSEQVLAHFDSRAFNIPLSEVYNYFIWRQKDCIRNSVNALGQSKFSQKQLQGKNVQEVKYMLLAINEDWEKYPTWARHGSCYRYQRNVEILKKVMLPESNGGRDYYENDDRSEVKNANENIRTMNPFSVDLEPPNFLDQKREIESDQSPGHYVKEKYIYFA